MKITPRATGFGGVIQMFEHKLLMLVKYKTPLLIQNSYVCTESNAVVLRVPSLLVVPGSATKANF